MTSTQTYSIPYFQRRTLTPSELERRAWVENWTIAGPVGEGNENLPYIKDLLTGDVFPYTYQQDVLKKLEEQDPLLPTPPDFLVSGNTVLVQDIINTAQRQKEASLGKTELTLNAREKALEVREAQLKERILTLTTAEISMMETLVRVKGFLFTYYKEIGLDDAKAEELLLEFLSKNPELKPFLKTGTRGTMKDLEILNSRNQSTPSAPPLSTAPIASPPDVNFTP